jgi:hypothetical protein
MTPKRPVRDVRVRRWWLAAVAALVAAVAGAVTWALWPQAVAVPHARHYLDVSACLLTGPDGIVPGTQAAPVWAAMRSASLASHVMVTYLADTGRDDVKPMLNTLVERQCGVIVATGDAAAAVVTAGKANPGQRFLLITGPGSAPVTRTPNIVIAPEADAAGQIDHAIRALAAQAPPPGS